jgi:uncharacterized protein (TIGR03435 family)
MEVVCYIAMSSFRFKLPVCLVAVASALAQTAPSRAPLAFDAASVRPSKPGSAQHTNVPLDAGNVYATISPDDARSAAGGLLIATHQPLWRYITFAYKLSGTQELALRFNYFSGLPKSGAPTWVTGGFDSPADAFDIEARAPLNPSIDEMRLMMQALLADRFHLVVHYQTSEASSFALVLVHSGVLGPNLRPHSANDACSTTPQPDQPAAVTRPELSPSFLGGLPPVCGVIAHIPSSQDPSTSFGARRIPLALLATSLPTMTGMAVIPRPVVDQTGLTGFYDFTLHWAFATGGSENGDNSAAFHEALKNQLGLELKSSRAPIDILIIDHVERPSEN